jgi:hypothetical protein
MTRKTTAKEIRNLKKKDETRPKNEPISVRGGKRFPKAQIITSTL